MKKTDYYGQPTPTANIAINKSRLKVYNKKSEVPTYYLSKGQEFQIELFNPTKDTVLAKISLNGKAISQGGLVLRPGERTFLDRYLDVARKFKFDTYEVANNNEVRKAIEDNGDFMVQFYRETKWDLNQFNTYGPGSWRNDGSWGNHNLKGLYNGDVYGINSSEFLYDGMIGNTDNSNMVTLTGLDANYSDNSIKINNVKVYGEPISKPIKKSKRRLSKETTIETGRVEKGSVSNQEFNTVDLDWEYTPFHTVKYKMLPVSQKVNTVKDVQVKRYCTNCGTKTKPTFKFCPNCGTKC